jgi:hypothetical protein
MKMYLLNRLATAIVLFLVGYALFGCVKAPIDSCCLIFKPIMISKDDKFTAGTIDQIYQHDKVITEMCDK